MGAILYLLALLASLALIAKAGNIFVNSACAIARGLGVPKAVIGLTLVSFATTAPEFITSVSAASLGRVEMAYGNAVGTCIFNAVVILGIAALIASILVGRERLHEGFVMLVLGGLVTLLALDGEVDRFDALVLLLVLAVFLRFVLLRESNRVKRAGVVKKSGLKHPAILFLLGAAGIVVGAKLLIYSGVGIAALCGVSEATIGFTLVAAGTSLPELATAIISSYKGAAELSLGNVIGANILDLTWVLGSAALVSPLVVERWQLLFSNLFMILVMATILGLMRARRKITRKGGAGLLALYILYAAGILAFWR